MPTTVYVATLDTRHYTFTAVANTEADAISAMKRGWEKHTAQWGGQDDPGAAWERWEDGVRVTKLLLGECARDGTVL